jgi:hypothetical protein
VILFWRFLAGMRLSGLTFSSPMNTRRTPACAAFSMKFGILWQSGVDLDGEADLRAIAGAQLDQSVEQQLPIAVTGEIVVGDEKPPDALGTVLTDNLLKIVR